MYPMNGPAGGGLLRLHSTYRHDLKIYSSDEGRVQMSAAAFTQGLLDLEGSSLTPILVRCTPESDSAAPKLPLPGARGRAWSGRVYCFSLTCSSKTTSC